MGQPCGFQVLAAVAIDPGRRSQNPGAARAASLPPPLASSYDAGHPNVPECSVMALLSPVIVPGTRVRFHPKTMKIIRVYRELARSKYGKICYTSIDAVPVLWPVACARPHASECSEFIVLISILVTNVV